MLSVTPSALPLTDISSALDCLWSPLRLVFVKGHKYSQQRNKSDIGSHTLCNSRRIICINITHNHRIACHLANKLFNTITIYLLITRAPSPFNVTPGPASLLPPDWSVYFVISLVTARSHDPHTGLA